MISESGLMAFADKNDPKLLLALYEQYAPSLYGCILRFTPDEKLACAILKASREQIIMSHHSYDGQQCRPFTWMLQLTLKECKQHISLLTNETIIEEFRSKKEVENEVAGAALDLTYSLCHVV